MKKTHLFLLNLFSKITPG